MTWRGWTILLTVTAVGVVASSAALFGAVLLVGGLL